MKLNEEQLAIFNAVINSKKPFIIIQGKAGTGKSFLVKKIQQKLNCNILVPTNMAKSVYENAQYRASVIHSFFAGELDPLENEYQDPSNYIGPRYTQYAQYTIANKLSNEHHLILDEISMVRADLFEMINKICQIAKGNNLPFGGMQIIAVGDMLQLPPIVQESAEGDEGAILKYLQDTYGGIYFFNSKVFQSYLQEKLPHIDFFELKHSVRQLHDPDYEKLLDVLREPQNNQDIVSALEKINERVVPLENIPEAKEVTTIVTTNAEVDKINQKQLDSLAGAEQESPAEFQICKRDCFIDKTQQATLQFSATAVSEAYNSQDYYVLDVPSNFTQVLKYKIGSKVMFTKNYKEGKFPYKYSHGDAWMCPVTVNNGSFGIIKEVVNGDIIVEPIEQVGHETIKVKRVEQKRRQLKYDKETKKPKVAGVIQTTKQYPLKSGYAFTVHKSQGRTYREVVIDLSDKGMFATGQLYVALSRAESLAGVYLTKRLTLSDCMVDVQLIGFLNQMRAQQVLPKLPAEILAEKPLTERCAKFKEKIILSKLAQEVKDDIYIILKAYNHAYQSEKYLFAQTELERILDKAEPFCSDKNLLVPIRHALKESATKESCDRILGTIENLCSYMVKCSPTELFQTEHRMPVPGQDIPSVQEIVFDKPGIIGFTYQKLFAPYLQGASRVTLTEPWLVEDYQIESLKEFIDLLIQIKKPNTKLYLNLITRRKNNGIEQRALQQRLGKLKRLYADRGIDLNYENNFHDKLEIHDREIIADTGWKIKLGRGLHIWMEPQCAEREAQAYRPCNGGFSIIYMKSSAGLNRAAKEK